MPLQRQHVGRPARGQRAESGAGFAEIDVYDVPDDPFDSRYAARTVGEPVN